MRNQHWRLLALAAWIACVFSARAAIGQTSQAERVQAIKPPTNALPNEAASRPVTKFSFIVYGDTRGQRDGVATHRMDLVVSGDGGARIYSYTGEPDLRDYLKANETNKVTLDHLVKPGNQDSPTPYHYVVVRVEGERLDMEVIGVDWGRGFAPYRSTGRD